MRPPSSVLRYVVLLLALCLTARAYADDRSEARGHYQAGVKLYSGGDYRGAIREFSAAQQLAPADLNNFNLALCYDKLGDAEPAIQYYRAFLDKQPDSDKRAEVEASIQRLSAAQQSAASKRDDAKKAAPVPLLPVPAPSVVPAPAAPSVSADARRPPEPTLVPPPPPAVPPAPDAAAAPDAAPPARHKGPAIAAPAPTGDPQIDRLNAIDIDQIRDQRGLAAGHAGPGGPAVAATDAGPGQPGSPAGIAKDGSAPSMPNPDQPKPDGALYTKWWFWALVGVSGVVIYELATASSSPAASPVRGAGGSPPPRTGLTLLSW